MSTWTLVLAALGLFAGLHVLAVLLIVLERVHRPLREIERYADEIQGAGQAIGRHLLAVDEAATTRDLVTALPGALRKGLS